MSSITLTVMLHGLIALAPTVDSNQNNHIMALLIDAPASSIDCMGAHSPKLTVSAQNGQECSAAGCSLTGNQCDCTSSLKNHLITLEISPAPVSTGSKPNNQPPINEIPGTAAEAGDYAYVANLSLPPFNLKLKQAYLSSAPPATLFARMDVPFQRVTACSLVTRESKNETHIQSLSFHQLGRKGAAGEFSQALAQMVMAKLDIPNVGGADLVVRVHISDFDGQNDHPIELESSSTGYLVELSNEADVLARDAKCEDGVARHFEHFYDLADVSPNSPPPPRLIPHVLYSQGPKADDLLVQECIISSFNLMDRPICPMATFNP